MLTNVTNARRASIAQMLTAGVIINVSTFGSMFEQSLAPTEIVNASTFGSQVIVADQILAPARIVNTSTFGAPLLVPDQFLAPAGIVNASTFGAPSILGQGAPQTLTQTEIASATTFGAAVLLWDQVLAPARVANTSTFGAPHIVSAQNLTFTRLSNTSVFGSPTIFSAQALTQTSLTNTSAFGAPSIAAAAPAWATFELKNSTAVLTNGNLTLSSTTTTGGGRAAGPPANTGKKYFEVTITGAISFGGIGLVDEDNDFRVGAPSTEPAGGSCVVDKGAGKIYLNNATTGITATFANGNVVQVAVDIDAKLAWFRTGTGNWNNNAGYDPAAGTGGVDISTLGTWIFPFAWVYSSAHSYTTNFGASAWTYTPPTGFSGWTAKTDYVRSTLRSVTSTISLSNGNLTATAGSGSSGGQALALFARSSGKYYFSAHIDASLGASSGIGLGNGRGLQTSLEALGEGNNGICYRTGGGVYVFGSNLGSIMTYTTGDQIDCAVDIDARLAWFRVNGGNWNNSGTANPATGTGGKSIASTNWIGPMMPGVRIDNAAGAATFNFGPSYTYAAPSGFLDWPGV